MALCNEAPPNDQIHSRAPSIVHTQACAALPICEVHPSLLKREDGRVGPTRMANAKANGGSPELSRVSARSSRSLQSCSKGDMHTMGARTHCTSTDYASCSSFGLDHHVHIHTYIRSHHQEQLPPGTRAARRACALIYIYIYLYWQGPEKHRIETIA